jgi:hypothetical protein
VDGIVESLRLAYSEERQAALLGELQQRIYDLQPALFLFVRDSARVFHKNRLVVVDPSRRDQGEQVRAPGENRLSLTRDLAWWVKKEG